MCGVRMLHASFGRRVVRAHLSNVAGSRCTQGLSQVLRLHRVVV